MHHLKTTTKSAKSEIIKAFCVLFTLACERTSMKMHPIERKFVTGPESILFAVCMCALFRLEHLEAGAVKGLI